MAASPGVQRKFSPPPSPLMDPGTPPGPGPILGPCRLCARETGSATAVFSETGKARNLPDKVHQCLPILVTEQDELSKFICQDCEATLDLVDRFFQQCLTANQELIIALRKSRGSPLDLPTHINQYVRSFNPPVVPHIKVEPSQYCDVNLGYDENGEEEDVKADFENGEYSQWIDDDEYDEDFDPEDALFKVPFLPKKRGRGRPKKEDDFYHDPYFDGPRDRKLKRKDKSARGRKKIIPAALTTCCQCNKESLDHAANLTHWKEAHPDMEVMYKCFELELKTGEPCNFFTKDSDEVFKHRLKHKVGPMKDIKPEKMADCKICGKFFSMSFLINRHVEVHEDRKDFKCIVCAKDLTNAEELKAHVRQHEDPNDFRYVHCCELCGKRFTQRANLEAHLRVHSGYKPYSCDFCGKSFSQKGNMEEHRRVHTGERPFVCELCGAAFVRRSELVLHTRCAHTGERPFQCAYCPKSFQRRDLMRKHERIHTDTRPYSCQYCNKAFTQRDKMVVHTRLHTGERPYVCEVCGKGFCESGNLKKHMRVHGKEPPSIMHQNNKGKPAPASGSNSNSSYSKQSHGHQGQQQASNQGGGGGNYQQQIANESDTASNASSVVNDNGRPESIASPAPSHDGSHQIQLPQQYPATFLAAAIQQNPTVHHQQPSAIGNPGSSRQSTATPVHDIDNSDAGSERSAASPFVAPPPGSGSGPGNQPPPPHPAHHQPPQGIPYHMHQSLIQHLSDSMRDWYGGHIPPGGGAGGSTGTGNPPANN